MKWINMNVQWHLWSHYETALETFGTGRTHLDPPQDVLSLRWEAIMIDRTHTQRNQEDIGYG